MNKRNTMKLTTITASVALLLSLAFSGSAFAGPGKGKGPQTSIKVQTWCSVDPTYDTDNAMLYVTTLITDKSSDSSINAIVMSNTTQAIEGVGNNKGRDKFDLLYGPGAKQDGPIGADAVGTEHTIDINLCDAGLDPAANAVNAIVTVDIDSHKIFTAKCANHDLDGDGILDVFSDVKIGHLSLCPSNPQ